MVLAILDKGQAYIDGCLIRIFWHLLCRPSFLRYLLTELRKSLVVGRFEAGCVNSARIARFGEENLIKARVGLSVLPEPILYLVKLLSIVRGKQRHQVVLTNLLTPGLHQSSL